MTAMRSMFTLLAAGGLAIALAASSARAQPAENPKPTGSEAERAAQGATAPWETTSEGAGMEKKLHAAGEEEVDPSKHFNYIGIKPGHVFDYSGKDEFG